MKKLLGLGTAVLLCAVLAASVAPAGKSKQSVVNLNFATYVWQPTTVKAMGSIVDSWNKSHAGIQVHIVPVDVNSVHDKLLTNFVGGTRRTSSRRGRGHRRLHAAGVSREPHAR
jgi:ABC-type sugar transport system, periplasmic component